MAYGTIDSRFWTSLAVRALSNQQKICFIYLLTSPHRNMLGLYRLPAAYAADDLCWKVDATLKVLRHLTNMMPEALAEYDEKTAVVLIPNYLAYNAIRGEKQEGGALSRLAEIPATLLLKRFGECLKVHGQHLEKLRKAVEDRVTENGLLLFDTSTDRVSRKRVTVTVTDTASDTGTGTDRFAEFWKLYPRKAGKGKAEESFVKYVTSKKIFDAVMAGLRKHIGCDDWVKDDGQYIPHPTTWLNQRRWEDEPVAARGQGSIGQVTRGRDIATYEALVVQDEEE